MIQQALNKRLTFDIFQQQEIPVTICSNDMKSCYGHILQPVASLCLQCRGVPEAAVICAFTSIQLLGHHMHTVYGDSTGFFGGEESLKAPYLGQILDKMEMF